MGIQEIRNIKAAKTGSVMTVEQARKHFAGVKLGSNPMAGKFHADHYECSKGLVWFRSKWEANYALYLDWLVKMGKIKEWEYETETYVFDGLKKGTTTYRIDFKVFYFNGSFEIHEIKGRMDAKSATKLKRMKLYHPEVKIVLIQKAQYDAIIKSKVCKWF